jgi:hypothetical protein
MELKLKDIEANAVQHALNKYLESLDKSSPDKGTQLEIQTVKELLERIHSLSSAPGI